MPGQAITDRRSMSLTVPFSFSLIMQKHTTIVPLYIEVSKNIS